MAVKSEVIRLSPVLYVVKLSRSGVLVGSWDYDVSIVSILAMFITWGHRPKIRIINDIRHWANRQALNNASWNLANRGSRATIHRAMRVTGKIIYQPVIDNIRNIQLSKLLKQGGMADSIKCFAAVETDDNNVGMNRQQVLPTLENGNNSSSSGTSRSKCKLVTECQWWWRHE